MAKDTLLNNGHVDFSDDPEAFKTIPGFNPTSNDAATCPGSWGHIVVSDDDSATGRDATLDY